MPYIALIGHQFCQVHYCRTSELHRQHEPIIGRETSDHLIMKWIVLFFCVLAAVFQAMSLGDDLAENLAKGMNMSREEVQICINKTQIQVEDLEQLDRVVDDDLQMMDFDSSLVRSGCFFTCLLQAKEVMSGPHININKIKELTDSKLSKDPKMTAAREVIVNTCSDQVKGKTDECEVGLKFAFCIVKEVRKRF